MATSNADSSSSEINVVIIGETGTGKSTFINYLTNLFHNGSLNNLKVAIPTRYLKANMTSVMPQHHENDLEDGTRSKTSRCTKYTYTVEQVHFNFYDTPGINDTGGYLADNENVDRIFDCLESLQHLTALVLVLNGTQGRLTVNIRNVLERFRDRIPDALYSNLIVILTNCAAHTVNFSTVTLISHAPIFHMQNSAFSSDAQQWTPQIREILQRDWHISMKTMNEFIKTLLTLTPVSTESLSAMNDDRNAIRSVLHESRLMIMELQHIEDEIAALEQASNIYSANIEKYATNSGQPSKSIQINEITVTNYHNTICSKCNTVCHERCSLTETTRVGERVFRRCTVIVNDRCTICAGKCSYNMHYHDRRVIKSVPKTLKVAISSVANKYAEARKDKAACETKCETVQETKRLIEQSLQDQFIKVRDACLRVKRNCRGFNVAEELWIFVDFLKNDMNSLRSNSVVKKATRFVEKLEILADDLNADVSLLSIVDSSSANTALSQASLSPPTPAKRRTHTNNSKAPLKPSQSTSNTIVSEDLINMYPSPTTSLITQVERILDGSMNSLSQTIDLPLLDDDDQRRKRATQQSSSILTSNNTNNQNTNLGLRDSFRRLSNTSNESSTNRKYAEYSTERLIALSRESADECKLIAKELNHRLGGTSVGYLSPTQLLALCEQYAACRMLHRDELTRRQNELHIEIQQLTDKNPFEILSVPQEKLLHLTAVTLCLQNMSKFQ